MILLLKIFVIILNVLILLFSRHLYYKLKLFKMMIFYKKKTIYEKSLCIKYICLFSFIGCILIFDITHPGIIVPKHIGKNKMHIVSHAERCANLCKHYGYTLDELNVCNLVKKYIEDHPELLK